MTPPLAVADHLIPRVVFFGPSRSGKSALITRLIRAADPLGENPIPLSAATPPVGIQRELMPHLIRVPDPAAGPGSTMVVVDCDGQSAGELLSHPDKLIRGAARGALAVAVRSADALVLVVDAAASPLEVDRTFRAFGGFLDSLSEGRTFGREVGGLPVFLTLTKCDALALPDDEPTDWLGRVEARKAEVQDRFRDFFGDDVAETDAHYLDFGSIDLQVRATAVEVPKQPGFAPYAGSDGTFGIATLTHDVLPAARVYRSRTLRAKRRLRLTISGLGLVVGVMLSGLIALAAFGTGDPLVARIRAFQEREGPPSVRLSDRNLPRNRVELLGIRESPGFVRLPPDLRKYVETHLAEYDAYRIYHTKFQPPRLPPTELRTQRELAELTTAIATELAPPSQYSSTWTDTEAVKLRSKWNTDVTLLREAEDRLHDWYRGLTRQANQLLLADRPPDATWRNQINKTVSEAKTPLFSSKSAIPGSPSVPVRHGAALTYAPVFEFDRIDLARRDWIDTRDRLLALRNLADLLGLTTGPGTPSAILDLPEPVNDADSLALAGNRLRELSAAFPDKPLKHPEWQVDNFPDPARRWLEPRLRSVFDTGVRHVRQLLTSRLAADRTEDWRKLADGFLQQEPARDWGHFLGLIRRWLEPSHATSDPVQELVTFLRREQFEGNPKSIEIAIPDDLLAERLIPAGKLVLLQTPTGGTETELAFRTEGDGRRERPLTIHTFVPVGTAKPFVVRPGDQLTAQLPLRAGTQEYRLKWAAPRSAVYAFDALSQPPTLERVGAIPTPERVLGVRLTSPDGGLPLAPVLLPNVFGTMP